MARMELKVTADAARENVVLELWMDGRPLGHIKFDGATAEKHMQDVARFRATLADVVTPDLDPGALLDAEFDPKWRVPSFRIEQGRILALRHPGLGWLSFVFPDIEAACLSKWLTKDLPLQSEVR